MLDSLAGFFGGNQAAFIGGFHSLLQEATGCLAYTDWLIANKRIAMLDLSHTLTIARIGEVCKRIVYEVVHGVLRRNPDCPGGRQFNTSK